MSLETTLSKEAFTGNGVTTTFPFSFKVWKSDQVRVYAGVEGKDVDITDDCAIYISDVGGTVVFSLAPASGVPLVVCREMPFVQEDRYISGTRFDPHEIEDRLDQDCAERQELLERLNRAVVVPITSNKSGGAIASDVFAAAEAGAKAVSDIKDLLNSACVEDVRIVADSLRGFPVMSMDLGKVTEENEPINVPLGGDDNG